MLRRCPKTLNAKCLPEKEKLIKNNIHYFFGGAILGDVCLKCPERQEKRWMI